MRGARVVLGLAAASAAFAVALPASAYVRAAQADVTLQVVPRGNGSVTGAAAGSSFSCTKSEEPESCAWVVPAGTA